MKTNEFQDNDDIEKLEKLQCPAFFDKENFEKARNGLIKVWGGKVSASMSGLEYYPAEIEWIMNNYE